MDMVKLGKRGQLSLPTAVLKKLGLQGAAATFLVETTSDGAVLLRPAAVYPVEVYTEERIREFEEADRPTATEAARVRKALARPKR